MQNAADAKPRADLVLLCVKVPRALMEQVDREAARLDPTYPNRSSVVRNALASYVKGHPADYR